MEDGRDGRREGAVRVRELESVLFLLVLRYILKHYH
jgi:hypothetical protein